MSTTQEVETVQLAESGPTVTVRFAPAKKTASEKAPKFRAFISLPAPLLGMQMDFAIFERGGDYSIAVPSIYGVDAISVEPLSVDMSDGRTVYLADTKSDAGEATMSRLLDKVHTAFKLWRYPEPGKPKPTVQTIYL